MILKIVSRYDSSKILYQAEAESMRLLVEAAVKARVNLSGANLYGAVLYGADLYRADLSGANLSGAVLSGADLSGANLSGADLYGADLSGADLYRADLSGANLSGAVLSGANLSGAVLSGADLSGANLSGADLSGADLYGYYSFGPGGSRNAYTWARWEKDGYIVYCGCQTLNLKDFAKAVKAKHGKTYHAKWYAANIAVMRLVAKESEAAFRAQEKK